MIICQFSALYTSALICGKVACYWNHEEIVPTEKYDLQYTYIGGQVCISAHSRHSGPDDTYVFDGTICGGGKVNTPLLGIYTVYVYNGFMSVNIHMHECVIDIMHFNRVVLN